MRISESRLRHLIRGELLRESNVVPMDFRSRRVRKTLTSDDSDVFIFSGDSGQIARVIEMYRDDSTADGGRVVYEQYVQRDGDWVQEPAQTLMKSLMGFNSRYTPYTGTIDHLSKRKEEDMTDEEHIEREMAAAGFPDYQSPRHDRRSKAYTDAMDKAMLGLPSMSF